MIENIRKMWKIPELRRKIIYTFLMLVLFRLISMIPAPGVNYAALKEAMLNGGTINGNLPLMDLVNMMTGSAFNNMTIMAMGITPYINASIIMQLLTIAIPALERLSKEEDGRQKINRITRYVTVVLAALQAIGLVRGIQSQYVESGWTNLALIGISMATGTALAMWIGERITEKGVGNGISLLIFVGIISNLFQGIVSGLSTAVTQGTTSGWINVIGIIVTCIIMTVLVTFVELGEQLLDGGVVVNNLLSIGSQIGSHDSSRDIHLYGQHFVTLRDIQQADVFQHFEAGQHYFELAVCQLERGVVMVLKEIMLRVELAQDLQEPGRDDEQRAEIVVARLVSRQDVAWIDGSMVMFLESDGVHVVVCFQPAPMA